MVRYRRLTAALTIVSLAGLAVVAMPGKAEAGWCCRAGIGIAQPPVVVRTAGLCATAGILRASAYYPPPQRIWVPPHWQGSIWVPGHWA